MGATVTDKTVVRAVERLFQRPDIQNNLNLLSRRLPPSADILVAGGAIRNLIIDARHGGAPPTRDIDIFIGRLDRSPWPTSISLSTRSFTMCAEAR
jgi:hypothetical protein